MIDVHVLTHEGTREDWLEQCLASLEGQPIVVHVVDNAGRSVGEGRSRGYRLGTSDLVAYVDSDDYVLPGVFDDCLAALEKHRAVISMEHVEYESGKRFPFAKPGHNVSVYRRADVAPYLDRMAQSPHTTDLHMREIMMPQQLSFVGYVWRVHAGGDHHKTMQAMEKESPLWRIG